MSQSVNADESLLYGTQARRQELYPEGSNDDANMDAADGELQQVQDREHGRVERLADVLEQHLI